MRRITLTISFILSIIILNAQNRVERIIVQGLCGMCEERIENAALEAGAIDASWNADDKTLVLTIPNKGVKLDNIQQKIAAVGHDTGKYKAPKDIYDSLPGCCKYREDNVEQKMHPLRGKILDAEGTPLPGATLNWKGTTIGVATDNEGLFTIPQIDEHILVLNYVGYKTDTIDVGNGKGFLTITMGGAVELSGVEIVKKRRSSSFSFSTPLKIETLSTKELKRAACCNLSQSFETNASVDVSFTDAITGTRQIELLGLAGKYVKITSENIPEARGIDIIDGLSNIPGTWIESIQLSKGTGSVTNGFEGIAGQINVELKKPQSGEKLLANIYTNTGGNIEANLNLRQPLNKNWNMGILLHANTHPHFKDENNDTFADMPKGEQFIFENRWVHRPEKKWAQRFGIKVLKKTQKQDS